MIGSVSDPGSVASQRVAIVAGCEQDIVAAVVRRFLHRGDRVVVWGADPESLDAAPKVETAKAEQGLRYIAGDDFDQALKAALECGRIGALVSGAPAIGSDGAIGGGLDALHHRIMQAARNMPAGGQIVNIMSSAGRYRTGYFQNSADADRSHASKAAVDGAIFALTRQLGFELGPRRICVNAISLGWIRSRERDREWDEMTPREREFLFDEISLGRPGEPDEVAAAVEFLASEASSYVTCNAIDVNGGWWTS